MSNLRARLILAEDDFLAALAEGGDAILAFEQRWEALAQDIDAAAELNTLDDDLSTLAHIVATRLAALADTSADLMSHYNSLTSQLVDQLDLLMSELTIQDDAGPSKPRRSSSVNSSDSSTLSTGKKRLRDEECDDRLLSGRTKRQRTPPTPQLYGPFDRSPVLSSSSFSTDGEERSPKPERLPTYPTPPSISRKRRLSDADGYPPAIRHKAMHVGPRVHAVSDSFLHCQPRKQPSLPTSDNSQSIFEDEELLLPLDIQSIFCSPEPSTDLGHEFDVSFDPGVLANDFNCSNSASSLPGLDDLDRFLALLFDSGCLSSPPAPPLHPSIPSNRADSFGSPASSAPTSPHIDALSYATSSPATSSPATSSPATSSPSPITPISLDDVELPPWSLDNIYTPDDPSICYPVTAPCASGILLDPLSSGNTDFNPSFLPKQHLLVDLTELSALFEPIDELSWSLSDSGLPTPLLDMDVPGFDDVSCDHALDEDQSSLKGGMPPELKRVNISISH